MTEADRDRLAYRLAQEYLLGLGVPGITAELLACYQKPPPERLRPPDLAGIYERLLRSAQNRGMAPAVIGQAIGGIEKLSSVTFGFNPHQVAKRYGRGDELLAEIITTLRPRGKVRRTPNALWPQFCESALSGARFLAQFESAEKFYAWVEEFHVDDRKLAALPLLLSKEIAGFGFALACDFLKELGYFELAKPDVQVKAIFRGLSLCSPRADDYEVFKAVRRVARHQGTTAYDVDKTFWLVGSGRFYDHPGIGRLGRIRTDRDEFIRWARRQLSPAADSPTVGALEVVKPAEALRGPEPTVVKSGMPGMQRAPLHPPLKLSFDRVYRAISEQPGARTPELRTTGGVPFVAVAKRTRDGRPFISLPHSNRIYQLDWGYATNRMGEGGQRIGHYSVPIDEWAAAGQGASARAEDRWSAAQRTR